MKGIVYVSKATSLFSPYALKELYSKASIKNKELNITGYLFFETEYFLQYIEGEDDVVTNLWKILRTTTGMKS